MSLKPQDICILLKIVALDRAPWSYNQLAYELGMSASEVHAGVKRATEASLMRLEEGWGTADRGALEELLLHGVKYVFTPVHGALTRGIPTSYAAPPLKEILAHGIPARPDEPPPVWPDDEGEVRGYEFSPLYKSVPYAAKRDPRLYELLALVDAIRDAAVADRELAIHELQVRLGTQSANGKMLNPAMPNEAPFRAAGSITATSKIKRGGND